MSFNPINFGFYVNGVATGIQREHESLIPFAQHQLINLRQRFGEGVAYKTTVTAPDGSVLRFISDGQVDRVSIFVRRAPPPRPKPEEEKGEARAPYLWVGIKRLSGGVYEDPCDGPQEDDYVKLVLHVWEPSTGDGGPTDNEIVSGRKAIIGATQSYPLGELAHIDVQGCLTDDGTPYTTAVEYGAAHRMYHIPCKQIGYDPEDDGDYSWERIVVMDPAEVTNANPYESGEGVAYNVPTIPTERAFQLPDENVPGIRAKWIPGNYAIKVSAMSNECDKYSPVKVRIKVVCGKDPNTFVLTHEFEITGDPFWSDDKNDHIPFGYEDKECHHGKWWWQDGILADPEGAAEVVSGLMPRGIVADNERDPSCESHGDYVVLWYSNGGHLRWDESWWTEIIAYDPPTFCGWWNVWGDMTSNQDGNGYNNMMYYLRLAAQGMSMVAGKKDCPVNETDYKIAPSVFMSFLTTPVTYYIERWGSQGRRYLPPVGPPLYRPYMTLPLVGPDGLTSKERYYETGDFMPSDPSEWTGFPPWQAPCPVPIVENWLLDPQYLDHRNQSYASYVFDVGGGDHVSFDSKDGVGDGAAIAVVDPGNIDIIEIPLEEDVDFYYKGLTQRAADIAASRGKHLMTTFELGFSGGELVVAGWYYPYDEDTGQVDLTRYLFHRFGPDPWIT